MTPETVHRSCAVHRPAGHIATQMTTLTTVSSRHTLATASTYVHFTMTLGRKKTASRHNTFFLPQSIQCIRIHASVYFSTFPPPYLCCLGSPTMCPSRPHVRRKNLFILVHSNYIPIYHRKLTPSIFHFSTTTKCKNNSNKNTC